MDGGACCSPVVRLDLAAEGFRVEPPGDVLQRIVQDALDSVTPNGILGAAHGPAKSVSIIRGHTMTEFTGILGGVGLR